LCNDECEQVFQKHKNTLTFPPILHKSDTHLSLLIYITTTNQTVSAVLVQDVDATQHLVYQMVEKLALSLVHAARRLRPYFQNHNIIVNAHDHYTPITTTRSTMPTPLMVVYMYITMRYVDFISSPYLLVFGDDRVRGTREQRMLMKVVLVMLRRGARDSMGFITMFYRF